VIASLQAAEACKLLVGAAPAEGLLHIDLWSGACERIPLQRVPDCPCCGQRRFDFLAGG
jgi:molybdopterin/thiamine biosynthesis adenylyltransferase